MPLKVAALYQFAALPDFRELREPLRALAAGLGLKGSVLLAHEGINGTVAGCDESIDAFVREFLASPVRFVSYLTMNSGGDGLQRFKRSVGFQSAGMKQWRVSSPCGVFLKT